VTAGLRAAALRRATFLLPILFCAATTTMAETTTPDFSERLDVLWDYDKPDLSEQRFRVELARHPAESREALETLTQIARTQGLRRMFAAADATLDAVAARLPTVPVRVRVRYLLERGRTRNSSGAPDAAVPLFKDAVALAPDDKLPGADLYHVDALHMLGIAAPAAERLDWDRKALALAESSTDERTRRKWTPSLYHNIGWVYFEQGNPATALTYWKKALPLREALGDPVTIRVARWTIARGQRALGQLDEAEATQKALAVETENAGEPDGYVYEELAEIALARGDKAAAAPWARKAHALLKDDGTMNANEAVRLARLEEIGRAAAGTP
jgi:tetratricopeptide (TPR) repeat protein